MLRDSGSDVLIVSVGSMAGACLDAAAVLEEHAVGVTVVDPRWVLPVDPALPALAARHRLVVTVEDSSRAGGIGTAVRSALEDADVDVPVRTIGIPRRFLDHGKPADVRAEAGLSPQSVAALVLDVLRKTPAAEVAAAPQMVERSASR